ncbi:MAG: class I SAM-dependent methyltransferase [Pseudomonadota bacterium]
MSQVAEAEFIILVKAERDVAYESPDHLCPWGTRRDNSRNKRFNHKLERLFQDITKTPAVLDLGCSGGGFVKTCIDDGWLAVGLEGSNYSKIHKRAEWLTIPGFLFTCDITGNFDVLLKNNKGESRLTFDVVTSWDVIEHIAEEDLAKVAENVKKHLNPGGFWILSVSPHEEIINGVRLHQTVQPKEWWINKFKQLGFENLDEYVRYFNTQFIRGPKYDAPGSFHLVLCVDKMKIPSVPKERLVQRLYDRWLGSPAQRRVKRLIVGD